MNTGATSPPLVLPPVGHTPDSIHLSKTSRMLLGAVLVLLVALGVEGITGVTSVSQGYLMTGRAYALREAVRASRAPGACGSNVNPSL